MMELFASHLVLAVGNYVFLQMEGEEKAALKAAYQEEKIKYVEKLEKYNKKKKKSSEAK